MSITPETVFAVSGGARGITAQCVLRMAQQYHCRFILIGRTPLVDEPAWAAELTERADLQKSYFRAYPGQAQPVLARKAVDHILAGREIRATLRQLASLGSAAEYVTADVTHLPSLQSALQSAAVHLGAITGILHGAGNLADKPIEQKTGQDFEYVYSAKIDGLKNLLACVPSEQLDYLILFSSAAGFFGNPGQADYAIANEILNKVAFQVAHTYPHCRVHSLNWGPWDGGMVTPQVRALFTHRKIEIIPVEAGTQALIDELEANPPRLQVVIGSMQAQPPSLIDTPLKTHIIRRRMSLSDNPFLQDHQIGQHAVLPMIHALNWIASTCENLYPQYRFFRCENYQVLKGIVFDDQLAPEHVLQIKEVAKDQAHITFDCLVQSDVGGVLPRYHYRVRIILVQARPTGPQFTRFTLNDTARIDGTALYQDGTLFHGRSLQGVRRVLTLNEHGLTMECWLPPVTRVAQGQFAAQAFNPFLGDIQLQGMVIWARKMRGVASLPLQCEVGAYYGEPLPGEPFYVSLEVHETTPARVRGDLILHNAAGDVYAYVTNGQVVLSEQLNSLFSQKA